MKLIKSKKLFFYNDNVHFITWATFSGMDYSFAQLLFGKPNIGDEKLIRGYSDTVQYKKETACLYPLPITIMPHFEVADEIDIYNHLNDVIEAQKKYIKADKMVFDMRNYRYKGTGEDSSLYKGVSGIYRYLNMLEKKFEHDLPNVDLLFLVPMLNDADTTSGSRPWYSFSQYDEDSDYSNNFVDEVFILVNDFGKFKE